MPPEENLSPLEKLRAKLYDPSKQGSGPVNPTLRGPAPSFETESWTEPPPPPPKKKISRSAYFLIGAAVFFVLATVLAVLFLFFGTRSVSTDRVDVVVTGPTSIASGDKVDLTVTVTNRNPAPIESTLLTVQFPPGAQTDGGEAIVEYSDTMGDVVPGEKAVRTTDVVISGSANQVVTIPVTFEYRIQGSNAVFVKREEYRFTITSSPVAIAVNALKESASGQTVTVTATVRANGVAPVDNVAVLASYPPGFEAQSIDPTPISGNLFSLGTLTPGSAKTITVTGVLSGQQDDERVFKFTAGVPKNDGSHDIAIAYTTQDVVVRITRPFLGVALTVNRSASDDVVVRAGTQVQGGVSWTNTLPTPVLDGEIQVRVSGTAADTRAITSTNGFYRSSDQTVIFNRDTASGLRSLEPGDTGSGGFTVPLKTGAAMQALRNPTLVFTVSVAGKRVGEAGVPETVTSTLTREVKVATDLSLTSRAVRSIGPFTNTGPWPPVPDQETTYTILLTAANTVNSVGGAQVKAVLPSYVRFTGNVNPSDGSVTYNATTREVTWSLGDMPAGTTGRSAAFQVSLLPSTSQGGTSPVLVFPQTITGTDRFIMKQVTNTAPDLTTQTVTDPNYVGNYGTVKR